VTDKMFRDVVEPSIKVGSKRGVSVPLSMSVHGLIVALLIIAPVLAPGVLPTPPTVLAYISATPSLPPAPPPSPLRGAPRTASASENSAATAIEAPRAIVPESIALWSPEGVVGVEHGVGVLPIGVIEHQIALPPAPPDAPAEPVHVGSGIRPPTKIKDVRPAYPAIAVAGRVEGVVIIEATIGPTGRVQDARVLRSHPLLEAAAVEAVRQWEFTPTLLNGKPIPVIMTVTVDFRLG